MICENCGHGVEWHRRSHHGKFKAYCTHDRTSFGFGWRCRCKGYVEPTPTLVLANGEPPEHMGYTSIVINASTITTGTIG